MEEAATPFPREETTPPVTNIYFGAILSWPRLADLPNAPGLSDLRRSDVHTIMVAKRRGVNPTRTPRRIKKSFVRIDAANPWQQRPIRGADGRNFSSNEGFFKRRRFARRLHFIRRVADHLRNVNSSSLDIRNGVRETALGTNSIQPGNNEVARIAALMTACAD
jgi:hypothetical protein